MLHRWAPIWSTITAISVSSMAGSVYLAQTPGLTEEMLQMWCKLRPELCAGMQPSSPQTPSPATPPPAVIQQQAFSSAAAAARSNGSSSRISAAQSGLTTSPAVTVTAQDSVLGLELRGPSEGRIGQTMNMSYKIFNRTSTQLTGLSYSMVLPMADTSTLRPGQGCSISGRTLTCTNLVIPANSSFFGSFNIPVTRESCALTASLPVTVQKMSAMGSLENSVSAIHRWTWNCVYEPVETDIVDVTALLPSRVLADQSINLPVTIKNKSTGAIGYRIVLNLPRGVTPESLPGCGWSGDGVTSSIMCFSNTTLAPGQQFTYTFGRFKFGRELCGQTVQLEPIRVEATTESGPAYVYGRTLAPISIPVECGPVTSSSSSASSSASIINPPLSSTSPSSASRASSSVPLDRFSITNGTPTCVTADCRTVSVPLSLTNTGPTPATRVAMIATMDTAWSNATLQGVSCLIININGTTERRFICPGGFDLTVPAGATANYSITLTTALPCPIANPRREVLIQSAPASVFEQDYSNNSVFVPLPLPCQAVSSAASSRAASSVIGQNFSSSRSSVAAGDSITLQSINITGDYVRIDYSKSFDTCAHLLTTNGQITHAQNYFCKASGPVTLRISEFNTLFRAGSSFKLCHGNNQNLCSSTVVATQIGDPVDDDRNPVYIRFPLEGEWNYNPKLCFTDDCRKIVMPLEFGNKNAAATDVMISGVVGSMWNTMTVKGLNCSLRSNATPNGKTYTCPKMTIPANTAGYTVGLVLTTTAPCPVVNAPFVNLAFTGALKTAQTYPSDISRNIPLPCGGEFEATSSSTAATSSASASYSITLTSNPAPTINNITVQIPANGTVTFTMNEVSQGQVGGGISWNWNTSFLQCAYLPNNPKVLNCTAIRDGVSTVSVTSNPYFSNGTNRIIESNRINVFADALSGSSGSKASSASIVCGNGIVQAFEICDDGNKIDTDACRNNCTINFNPQTCGNGIREGTEQCDDGNQNEADLCTSKCTNIRQPVCGDGRQEGIEECDDGNRVDTDSCSNTCKNVTADQAGKIILTQVSGAASATALSGQSNIPVMRFTASAEKEAVTINTMGFSIGQTNPSSGITFSLWKDTDGEGTVDTKVADLPASSTPTPTGYGYIVNAFNGNSGVIEPGENPVLFEVRAAIGSAAGQYGAYYNVMSAATFSPLTIKASIGNTPLTGEQINGTCGAFCAIHLKTTASFSPAITVYRTGSLFVSRLYPFVTQTYKRGELGPSALNVLMEARREDVSVTDLQFALGMSESTSVERLEFFEKDGTTSLGTATTRNCAGTATWNNPNIFCLKLAKGAVVIPAGGNKSFEVRPFIKADLPASTSINTFRVSLQNALPSAYMMNIYTECGAAVCGEGMTSNRLLSNSDKDGKDYGELIIGAAAAYTPVVDRNIEGASQNISPN